MTIGGVGFADGFAVVLRMGFLLLALGVSKVYLQTYHVEAFTSLFICSLCDSQNDA